MKKKLISIILASALPVGLLSACGSDSSKDNDANSKIDTTETGSNTTKSDTSSAPVSVTLNEVAHSIFYAPMYVAIENGYFEEEGIDLTLVTGFGADKVATAVVSGDADIGFMGSESSIYIYHQNPDDYLVNFAQLTQRAGNFLVSRKPVENFQWDDLKGSYVLGGRAGGMPEMVFEFILKKHNIDPTTDLAIDQSIDFGSTAAAFTGSSSPADFTVEFEPAATTLEQEGAGYVIASLGEASGYCLQCKTKLSDRAPGYPAGIYQCPSERHGLCTDSHTGRDCQSDPATVQRDRS